MDALNDDALLSDEQVREFVANGFVRLTPDVPLALHDDIDAALRQMMEDELRYRAELLTGIPRAHRQRLELGTVPRHGNDILARVPKMRRVLNCAVVRGAVASIVGPDYCLHPHRALHGSTPIDARTLEETDGALPAEANAPRMGEGSKINSAWHQDAHSPLARARHHLPRYLIGYYFPHETPVAMGPTRIQAGSHLYPCPVAPSGVVLEDVPAGTFFLLHYDLVHAGFPNRTARTRYMAKFVFARTRHPEKPNWRSLDATWRRPANCLVEYDAPKTWAYIWNWMRGVANVGASDRRSDAAAHIAGFGSADQKARLESIYGAAAGGDVPALADALLAHAGQGKHERARMRDRNGRPLREDIRGAPRRWNERGVVMEDAAYALAASGDRAVPALQNILATRDPWMQINAAFALGELGPTAADAVPNVVALLDSPHSQVVRQALDALGAIGEGLAPALAKIERLLKQTNPAWQEEQVKRGWTAEDQVRMNAVAALLSALHHGEHTDAIERIASAALGDKNGYVSAIAREVLGRVAC